MATVTRYPTTDTAVSGTWTTPTNVQADDGNTASVTIASKNASSERQQGSYGFDSAIPSGATINSVAIEVEHRVTTTGGIAFLENYGRVGTTAGAINSDNSEPLVLTAVTYANYARPGGGSWTRDDLLNANFTTRVRARSGNNATSVTYHWDYIRVTVDYTASQAYSLTAESGSVAVSGTAATLKQSRKLSADSGSHAVTGTAASLERGYKLSAVSGSYAWTGTAANLGTGAQSYALTADAGSYIATGTAATLKASRVLIAGSGTFTLANAATSFSTTATPASPARGGRKKGKQYTYVATIDGERMFFSSLGELLDYLDSLKEEKVEEVKQKAEKEAAKPSVKFLRKAAPKVVASVPKDAQERVRDINLDLQRTYIHALRAAVARRADEDDVEILLSGVI